MSNKDKLDPSDYCVDQFSSIRDTIAQMDRSRIGIALVVDQQRHLIGTVTDGDIRRGMLANINFDQSITRLLKRKAGSSYAVPVTAPVDADPTICFELLKRYSILHLPLLDEEKRVAGLVTLDDFLPRSSLPLQAVIMAGGRGSRMNPLTDALPKPMLPVGDQPLMEIIIHQLRDAGIRRVNVTTHHKSEKITEHFGDGSDFGVELNYVNEDRPLGTAGGLGLMEAPQETLLVINGDILSQVDFRAMLAFHREQHGDLTIAVRQYDIRVPFGVVECEGASVQRLTEKPVLNFFVNAGIYLLEPMVYQHIPNGKRFDMTDLIGCLLEKGRRVVSFPVREYWLDVGLPDDYVRAQKDITTWKEHR